MVEVEVVVDSTLPTAPDIDGLARVAAFSLRRESAPERGWIVTLVLTTNDRLRRLHEQFMSIDETTDVMTFAADAEPGDLRGAGDVVISVERAAEQSAEHGMSAWDEVRFLAVHGCLHLCGWRDDTDDERDRMLQRQSNLISAFDRGEAISEIQ